MSEKENEAWELSKENIRPIKQGRRTKGLKVGLASCTDNAIEPQLHLFENELCTYSGDDPLSVWYRYIIWVEQNLPKSNREEHMKQLIERCFSTFRKEEKYFNDDHFVDIMLKYAILSGRPLDFYNYMFSNKIGFKSAKFYINWSQELEQQDSLRKADEILIYGIECQAEPHEKLLSYYKNFQIRFPDKLKSNSNKSVFTSENGRSAFVKPQKKKLSSTSELSEAMIENKKLPLVHGRCQPQPKTISGKVPFKINDSVNTIPSFKPQSYFPIHSNQISENFKENEQECKQKETHDHCLQASNTTKQAFKFYCDEENEQKIRAPRSYPESSKFMYTCSETFNPPVALFELEDPLKKPMYPKHKVYKGTTEFSLEEIRASEWLIERKRIEQENLLIEQQKKIDEQKKEGDELKRKVEYLAKQLELLQSCLGNSDPKLGKFLDTAQLKTDINSLESINTPNREVKRLKTENFRAFENCENSTQHAYSDLKHGFKSLPPCSSPDSLNIKSLENKDPVEVGMYDTAKVIQELYNRTLFSSAIEEEHKKSLTNEFTEKCSLISSTNLPDLKETGQQENVQRDTVKEFNHNLSFSFYHDPTVVIDSKDPSKSCLGKEKDPLVSPNLSSEEDVENIPPKGYVQESSKRELAGILQPSKNILFIPLEEQEEAEDNSDIEENSICCNERQYTDDTLIPPSNTEQFRAAKFISSTPYLPRNSILEKSERPNTPDSNGAPLAYHLPVESPNIRTKECDQEDRIKTELKFAREPNSLLRQSKMLSVIMETSAETYSKSSSSSSGSLTRSNNLDQILSNRMSMLKQCSKLETCEPSSQNSVSDVSHGISEINCQNFSEIPHKFTDMDLKVQLHIVDIDPFDQEINQKFLDSLNKDDYKNLYFINKSMKPLKEAVNVSIGNESYRIISLVAEGAYAKVFEAVKCASVMDINSKKFALKVCKNSDEWEFYICAELQKRLLEKNMPDIRNSFMRVISAEKFLNGIILVSDFCTLGTLLDVVNFYKKQNSTMPELIIMYFTLEILLIVSRLHECNIIHGDLKPDNFLLTQNAYNTNSIEKLCEVQTLQLIDFGRAIDLNFFNKGTCFTYVLKADYFKCNEMKDNKPWVFQLDWYGVASCIHTMLFSDYMAVKKENNVWRIQKKLRRYWSTSLWDSLFNKLLNIPECYQEPDIQSDISTIQSKLQQNSANFLSHLNRYTRSKNEK